MWNFSAKKLKARKNNMLRAKSKLKLKLKLKRKIAPPRGRFFFESGFRLTLQRRGATPPTPSGQGLTLEPI